MPVTVSNKDTTAIVKSVQYKKNIYLYNGKNALQACDGLGFRNAGIEAVKFTPGVAVGSAGVLTGRYAWIMCAVNSKQFNGAGYVMASGPSYVSAELSLNLQQGNISNIPATHVDSQVDMWYLYRNLAGARDASVDNEEQNWYFVAAIPIGTTSYVDNIPDAVIERNETARFEQMPMPTGKSATIYGDRLFVCGFDPLTTGLATLVSKTISKYSLTSDVVTLTYASAHGYTAGQWITVATAAKDFRIDGPVRILATPSGTTLTFNKNNQQVDIGDVTDAGTTQVIQFSGTTIPDGVLGCWFQASGDSNIYRIYGRNNSTEIVVAGQSQFGYQGSLTASAYTIFQYEHQIFFSAFQDVEVCGPDYSDRYVREVPGFDPARVVFAYEGKVWAFSDQNIYAIIGKGENESDVTITPEPVYKNLGCVGPNALDAVDGTIFFMSLRGPCIMQSGQEPQVIGNNINFEDYISKRAVPLTATDLKKCAVGCKGHFVEFWIVANSGDTDNSLGFRYDRNDGSWWPMDRRNPLFFVHDNGDGGLNGRTFFVQGGSMFETDVGDVDVVAAVITGTVTSATTLSITDSAQTFPTSAGGILEAYADIFDSGGNFVASRRITGQSSTTGFSWDASNTGGGAVAGIVAGYTYRIGAIWWTFKTKTMETPAKRQKAYTSGLVFDVIDSSAVCIVTNYFDAASTDGGQLTAKANPTPLTASELVKRCPINTGNFNFALKFESYTGARIREFLLDMDVKEGRQ